MSKKWSRRRPPNKKMDPTSIVQSDDRGEVHSAAAGRLEPRNKNGPDPNRPMERWERAMGGRPPPNPGSVVRSVPVPSAGYAVGRWGRLGLGARVGGGGVSFGLAWVCLGSCGRACSVEASRRAAQSQCASGGWLEIGMCACFSSAGARGGNAGPLVLRVRARRAGREGGRIRGHRELAAVWRLVLCALNGGSSRRGVRWPRGRNREGFMVGGGV